MISDAQLRELFELYDRFHGALNPLAPDVLMAEREFFSKLQSLHSTHAADVPFPEIPSLCRPEMQRLPSQELNRSPR